MKKEITLKLIEAVKNAKELKIQIDSFKNLYLQSVIHKDDEEVIISMKQIRDELKTDLEELKTTIASLMIELNKPI